VKSLVLDILGDMDLQSTACLVPAAVHMYYSEWWSTIKEANAFMPRGEANGVPCSEAHGEIGYYCSISRSP